MPRRGSTCNPIRSRSCSRAILRRLGRTWWARSSASRCGLPDAHDLRHGIRDTGRASQHRRRFAQAARAGKWRRESTGFLDQQQSRHRVPRVERELDKGIVTSCRDVRELQRARAQASHRGPGVHQRLADCHHSRLGVAIVVAEADERSLERSAIADPQTVFLASVRVPGAMPPPRMKQLIVLGIDYDSDFATAPLDVGDRHAVVMCATQEVVRAIDRIDDPDALLIARDRRSGFLAEKRITRKRASDFLADQHLDRAVGLAYVVLRTLGLDGQRIAAREVVVRKLARLMGDRAGRGITCLNGRIVFRYRYHRRHLRKKWTPAFAGMTFAYSVRKSHFGSAETSLS